MYHSFINKSALFKGRNIWALLIKNLTQLRNQIGFLFFQFATPAIQISLYFWCVGGRRVCLWALLHSPLTFSDCGWFCS